MFKNAGVNEGWLERRFFRNSKSKRGLRICEPTHVGLGPTEAQKGAEKVVVGHELRMNGKKNVFGDWLQLTRLRQLGRLRLLGGLFWKDRCLCEQFMHFWFNTWCYGLWCNTLWKPVIIQGSLNAARNINEVLEPVLLPYLQGHRNCVFQQDKFKELGMKYLKQKLII
ncbi:hypothetical protein GEV33_004616 [Tenebrio molitor]|uniref:Uncharacterized protein n=1 Tax=Tenebrio molitor TaxID=7067 RepID=A0A8J6HP32_TENMO|nr:hypothetical protein GEV33_004616 [Tenebrio molitor]